MRAVMAARELVGLHTRLSPVGGVTVALVKSALKVD